MKKMVYLITVLSIISTLSAQNKKLTLYYSDSTTVVNIDGLDSMTVFICGASKVSYGGKDYNTVLIGDQCWFKENLDVGAQIMDGQWPGNNSIIEKYCYSDLPANCETYGGLYMWDEAMKYVTAVGSQGICPDGWHMPTMAEFQSLANYVNNNSNELKREDQGSGIGQGTNITGFSALLAGAKSYSGGPFQSLGESTNYWMGELGVSSYACNFQILGNDTTINLWNNGIKTWALSVRCIKDN